ncbi:MAG: MotA/TolQ/ExbB proton channel family protein [Planctomycetes bacterium]|nr:MotA/TolQ/ExbB proton channel family protein [Planctomycetota bacterium]
MNPVQAAHGGAMPSLWELIASGGPLMWPLGLCSVIALAFVVERALRLRRAALGTELSGKRIVDTLRSSGTAAALELARAERTPQARVVTATLEQASASPSEREKRVEDLAALETKRLSGNLRPLMIVYVVAPLLGLLGTVWGLIEAFATVATKNALGRPELLAAGVYQALVTTAAGLAIAIPAVVAYYHFKGRIENFARGLEQLYGEIDPLLVPREVPRASA